MYYTYSRPYRPCIRQCRQGQTVRACSRHRHRNRGRIERPGHASLHIETYPPLESNEKTKISIDIVCTENVFPQRAHDAIMISLLPQNDVATSFWRNNDVVIASCARWVVCIITGACFTNRILRSLEVMTWISNQISIKLWGLITHPWYINNNIWD